MLFVLSGSTELFSLTGVRTLSQRKELATVMGHLELEARELPIYSVEGGDSLMASPQGGGGGMSQPPPGEDSSGYNY